MQVILKAIKFNHDPLSETGDAFNIRRNETEPVNVPEWRRDISVKPEDSPAAYAICETRGHTITIQAQFSSTDISNAKVLVRAVAARPRRQRSGLIGSLLRAFGLVTAVVPKHLRRGQGQETDRTTAGRQRDKSSAWLICRLHPPHAWCSTQRRKSTGNNCEKRYEHCSIEVL